MLRLRRETVARNLRVLEEQIKIWTRERPDFPRPLGSAMMYDWHAVQEWADGPGAEMPGLRRWRENRDSFVPPGQMGAREITEEYGISSATFWNWQRQGAFPEPAAEAPLLWGAQGVADWVRDHGRKLTSFWRGQGIEALSMRGVAKLLNVSQAKAERLATSEDFPRPLLGSEYLWNERHVKDWALAQEKVNHKGPF